MDKLLTVLTPFYNNHSTIKRCVRSIEKQSLSKELFDHIIIDDCSDKPLTGKIGANEYNHLAIVRHDSNMGLPSALNTGLEYTNTRYFIRLDADDYMHRLCLEVLHETIRLISEPSVKPNKGYVGVSCDYKTVDNEENTIKLCSAESEPIGCGIIFKTDVVKSIGGYNEKMRMAEEVELRKRLDIAGKIYHLNMPLYRYVRHDSNMTNNDELYKKYINKIK